MKKSNQIIRALVTVVVVMIMLFLEVPLLPILLSAIIVIMVSLFTGGLKQIGLSRSVYPLGSLLGIAIGMAIVINLTSLYIITPVIENLTNTKLQLGAFSSIEGNTSVYLISLLIGWVIGGFAEEIIFRGFLLSTIMGWIPGKTGEIVGVIVTSAIFGYLHEYQGLSGQLSMVVVGLFLGGIFLMNRKKLWLNIVLHGTINTMSMTALYLGWIQIT